ncbi:hypothetical protein HD554DRAFT_1033173 [Boletus coccyginus]|nr:hypothetical protein HD554DRAFT_1033173 [Boletus coccyginus]
MKKTASAIAAGFKTYFLRSILDATIIEEAALSDERLKDELGEGPDDGDDNMPRNHGSIVSGSTAGQLATCWVFLHIVLAFISVNGQAISGCTLLLTPAYQFIEHTTDILGFNPTGNWLFCQYNFHVIIPSIVFHALLPLCRCRGLRN